MPKLKVQNRFWIIPNELLNNPEISWKAKWLFWYLQSKPDDWDFAVARICNDATDWEKATISWIKELEDHGYLIRKKYQNERWHWEVEYILFDNPITYNRQAEKEPVAENPVAENPVAENRQTNKKRNTKKEIQINRYISNEAINNFIIEFIENRKQLKKPMTDLAITKLVNKCNEWLKKYKDDEIKIFFDRAIESGWQWVFELNEIRKSSFQKNPPQKSAYEQENVRKEFSF